MVSKYKVDCEWVFVKFGAVRWEEFGSEYERVSRVCPLLSLVTATSYCQDILFDED